MIKLTARNIHGVATPTSPVPAPRRSRGGRLVAPRSALRRLVIRRLLIPFVILAASVVPIALFAPSAQASDTWVYVVVNNRVCGTSGTYARGILANVQPTGWTSGQWDTGDNIIYPKVRLHTTNTLRGQVMCQRKYGYWWITVGYRTIDYSFVPSYYKQTIWLG